MSVPKSPRAGTRARALFDLLVDDARGNRPTKWSVAKQIYCQNPPALRRPDQWDHASMEVGRLLRRYADRVERGLYRLKEEHRLAQLPFGLACQCGKHHFANDLLAHAPVRSVGGYVSRFDDSPTAHRLPPAICTPITVLAPAVEVASSMLPTLPPLDRPVRKFQAGDWLRVVDDGGSCGIFKNGESYRFLGYRDPLEDYKGTGHDPLRIEPGSNDHFGRDDIHWEKRFELDKQKGRDSDGNRFPSGSRVRLRWKHGHPSEDCLEVGADYELPGYNSFGNPYLDPVTMTGLFPGQLLLVEHVTEKAIAPALAPVPSSSPSVLERSIPRKCGEEGCGCRSETAREQEKPVLPEFDLSDPCGGACTCGAKTWTCGNPAVYWGARGGYDGHQFDGKPCVAATPQPTKASPPSDGSSLRWLGRNDAQKMAQSLRTAARGLDGFLDRVDPLLLPAALDAVRVARDVIEQDAATLEALG